MKKILSAAVIICLSSFLLAGKAKVFKKLYTLEGTWKMITKRVPFAKSGKKLIIIICKAKGT